MTTKEKYDYKALHKMLKSSDEESYRLALQCIEHMDMKANLVTILLLYKDFPEKDDWGVFAPEKLREIEKFLDKRSSDAWILTYRDIMKMMQKQMVGEDQVEQFLIALTDTVKKSLVDYGFDFIEDVSIILKKHIDE